MKDGRFERSLTSMSKNDLGTLQYVSVRLEVFYKSVDKQKSVDRELYIQKCIKKELSKRR